MGREMGNGQRGRLKQMVGLWRGDMQWSCEKTGSDDDIGTVDSRRQHSYTRWTKTDSSEYQHYGECYTFERLFPRYLSPAIATVKRLRVTRVNN